MAKDRDVGLREIDEWVRWFRAAHAERLAAYTPAERALEGETIERQATAIHERLRSDYLLRKR